MEPSIRFNRRNTKVRTRGPDYLKILGEVFDLMEEFSPLPAEKAWATLSIAEVPFRFFGSIEVNRDPVGVDVGVLVDLPINTLTKCVKSF
jgi:hypothetical protein